MLISLRSQIVPVTSRLLTKAGLAGPMSGQTINTVELAAAERLYSPGIISLPGESTRATGTMSHTTLYAIHELEREGEFNHGPTLAHEVRGTILADGCIYASRSYQIVTPEVPRRKLLPRRVAQYDEAQLCSDMPSEMYFGHWLLDGLCTERLALQRGLPSLVFDGTQSTHKQAYREICAVTSTRVAYAAVDRLWIVDDRGLNSVRLARWRRLRADVRGATSPSSNARYVYLTRSTGTAGRSLSNADEIKCALDRIGFVAIDPMRFDTRHLAELLNGAEIVVSIEGSHQSHALMAMPSGGTLLTIQPADRFLHSYLFFANAAGIRSAFVVADKQGEGYHLPVARLRQTIELVG